VTNTRCAAADRGLSKGLLTHSFHPALKNTTKLGPWWSQDPGEITDVISKDSTHTMNLHCAKDLQRACFVCCPDGITGKQLFI